MSEEIEYPSKERERAKVNVKVSAEVNTYLHDLYNQIQYEFCEQYEDEIKDLQQKVEQKDKEIDRLNNIIKELSKDVDMWNKKYNEQFNIITELEKWLEERTYGMNEIHTYKIGALEDEVILNKLKTLKENK